MPWMTTALTADMKEAPDVEPSLSAQVSLVVKYWSIEKPLLAVEGVFDLKSLLDGKPLVALKLQEPVDSQPAAYMSPNA